MIDYSFIYFFLWKNALLGCFVRVMVSNIPYSPFYQEQEMDAYISGARAEPFQTSQMECFGVFYTFLFLHHLP